jgi:lysozyme family protein
VNVEDYISQIIAREGGYADHPNDRGGPTNHGITQQVARAFGYMGDMRTMSVTIARQIYRERYWFQPGFSLVNMRSKTIAEELLDTGVNMGPGTAARFLQRALNTLNTDQQHYPDIGVDGAVGKMTLYALDQFLTRRGEDGVKVLLRMLNGQQSVRYIEISEADKRQESFQFGWQLHRVS